MRTVLLCLLLIPSYALSEPKVTINTHYYDVEAKEVSELLEVMKRANPIQEGNKEHFGHTTWKVWWEWKWRFKNNRCRMTEVNSFVDVVHTIPKLSDKHYNIKVLTIWHQWFPNLMRHEKNHVKYAVDIAAIGEKEILNIQSQKKCEELDASAKLLTSDLSARMKKLHTDYDQRTNHGRTEGADIRGYLPSL